MNSGGCSNPWKRYTIFSFWGGKWSCYLFIYPISPCSPPCIWAILIGWTFWGSHRAVIVNFGICSETPMMQWTSSRRGWGAVRAYEWLVIFWGWTRWRSRTPAILMRTPRATGSDESWMAQIFFIFDHQSSWALGPVRLVKRRVTELLSWEP